MDQRSDFNDWIEWFSRFKVHQAIGTWVAKPKTSHGLSFHVVIMRMSMSHSLCNSYESDIRQGF